MVYMIWLIFGLSIVLMVTGNAYHTIQQVMYVHLSILNELEWGLVRPIGCLHLYVSAACSTVKCISVALK